MSGVGAVAIESFEARIVKLEGERDARLSLSEARDRLLDALEGARQGHVQTFKGVSVAGDLFRGVPDSEMAAGMQVLSLPDFNAALDKAFPTGELKERDQ